jgi:hypothetical protein
MMRGDHESDRTSGGHANVMVTMRRDDMALATLEPVIM